ncbi:MAG: creatininase family protein [Janthinobacterium lividum]
MSPDPAQNLAHVQVELLLPYEIDAALAVRPVVYVPLGSIEYHSHHLPVGLDGLNAHGVCSSAAGRSGGLVLPTLYVGVGGGHTSYPWTIMAASAAPLAELLEQTLGRLADFGVRLAVLFTGHFADEQLALVDEVAARWNKLGDTDLVVLALSINRAETSLAPDHAGVFETTLLSALRPDRVQLDQIPLAPGLEPPDPVGAIGYEHRHDPKHPLWGVMGPDPRGYRPEGASAFLDEVVGWTLAQVEQALDQVV